MDVPSYYDWKQGKADISVEVINDLMALNGVNALHELDKVLREEYRKYILSQHDGETV